MTRKHLYIGFALMTLASCGGGGDSNGPVPPPVGNTPVPEGGITVRNNSYSPIAKTITAGASVEWAWNSCTGGYEGESCVAHSVTFEDGVTSPIQERGTYTRTFATAGSYDYQCLTHGAAMSGTVNVQ